MTVTLTVRVSDAAGNETVETHAFEAGPAETILTGAIGGVVPAGTVARLRGACLLTDNLHVRGTLLCDPTGVDLDGQNLFDIHTHDGTLNLVGVEKTAWTGWSGRRFVEDPIVPVVGWQVGDRLVVGPTSRRFDGAGKRLADDFVPTVMTWTGDWATMVRPAKSPNVVMVDGRVALPVVANLSQTATFRNLKRIMVHEASAPNPQTLKWIRVLNSGETGVLGNYPIHFHMIGDHARGSLLEGVVVEGGKNHAFVPHASHGITQRGCVAYNTTGTAYWWDLPPDQLPGENDPSPINDSEDIVWDRCLSIVSSPSSVDNSRLGGFSLGAGLNLACVDSVATCVHGNQNASEANRQRAGFVWPEGATRSSWLFQRCMGINNVDSGILIWQNARKIVNDLEDFDAINNGFEGINHGSYINRYHYARVTLTGNGLRQHAKSPEEGPLIFENILSDTRLVVTSHNSGVMRQTFYRHCTFPDVVYNEPSNGAWNVYEDCGLNPADFDLEGNTPITGVSNPAGIAPTSIIEIKEGGVLTHRWQSGVWS